MLSINRIQGDVWYFKHKSYCGGIYALDLSIYRV